MELWLGSWATFNHRLVGKNTLILRRRVGWKKQIQTMRYTKEMSHRTGKKESAKHSMVWDKMSLDKCFNTHIASTLVDLSTLWSCKVNFSQSYAYLCAVPHHMLLTILHIHF